MQRLFWRQRIRFSPVLWAQQCDSRVEVPIVAQNADRIESPWDTIQKNLRRTSPLVKSVIGAPSNHAERGPSSRRAFSGHQLMWCRSMRKEIPNATAKPTCGELLHIRAASVRKHVVEGFSRVHIWLCFSSSSAHRA